MSDSYSKQWRSLSDQLERLRESGLEVENVSEAESFLRHLNYYRFSGYGLAFEVRRHEFLPGTTFEDIRHAYEFDRGLRDLVYESMEVIELDVRTSVAYTFGETYGAFGHTDPTNFYIAVKYANSESAESNFDHKQWRNSLRSETRRSSEVFVGHFERKYSEFPDLPIWVATEIMSFGTLSRMIEGMKKSDVKRVATRYGLQPLDFISALHHLVYVRNICAHHARIWDREWSIKAELPRGKIWAPPLLPDNTHLFASLLLQRKFLSGCPAERSFTENWCRRLEELIDAMAPNCPDVLKKMGLTENWKEHPVWSVSE
ncbi:MAG: Abi family protein [Opitutales bacterium]|nr:Abi family protein [Opitutales bacterium]